MIPTRPDPHYQEDGISIYCGDAREIVPALGLDSVDLIWTDPPYGHNNNDGDLIGKWEEALGRGPAGEQRPIANDGREDADAMFRWLINDCAARLLPGGCCCCCCCGGGGPDPQFARWSMWMDEALEFKQMVVWDKGPMGMGWHYRRSYETVLVAQKPGAACKWYDETDRVENIIREIPKIIPQVHDHPTPKPPALAARFIRWHTKPGDLVLDPFMGAGPAMRAAKGLGRRAIGIEIERDYCDMAVEHLRQKVMVFM